MRIAERELLVTGADRGIGRALVDKACIDAGSRSLITAGEGHPIGGTS